MPLESEDPDGQVNTNGKGGSYFSLSSIKSMTKTGTSRLSSLKKGGSGYLTSAASQWMSPNSKESLTRGLSSIKSAYASASVTLSKKVEEIRDYQQQQQQMSPALSRDNLNQDETLSQCSNDSRRPSEVVPDGQQPELWSNITGQLWDQLMTSYANYGTGYDQSSQQQQKHPPRAKSFTDLFEETYANMPKFPAGPVAMQLFMTSCSRCNR